MIRFRSCAALAFAACMGAVALAPPASAFVAFQCTAKNAVGAKFSYEYFGILSFDAKISASSYALQACRAASTKPASCVVATCVKTHA